MKVNNITLDELGINPFIENFEYPLRQIKSSAKIKDSYQESDDKLTVSAIKGGVLHLASWKDARPCIKTFTCRVKLNALRSLSLKGRWLWDEIQFGTEYGVAFYVMNKSFMVRTLKFANQRELNIHIQELIEAGFISNTLKNNVFWFNPDFYIRGDTTTVFPKNGRKIHSQSDISESTILDDSKLMSIR